MRFLSAYQHSGLLALKGIKELPPVSPTTLSPVLSDSNQDNRILKKNLSMCEDLLIDKDSTMKNLWEKDPCIEYDFNLVNLSTFLSFVLNFLFLREPTSIELDLF